MHARIDARRDGERFRDRLDENQGFVGAYGVFMTREEACRVADAAGQIAYPEDCGQGLDGSKLYSE